MALTKLRKRLSGFFNLSRVNERVRKIPIVIHRTDETKSQPPSPYTSQHRSELAHYLCATAIIKNEGPYLAEWLEFHRLGGIEKFILYDNGSTDDTHEVLAPYITSGFIEVIPWTNFLQGANHQHLAYAHACANLAHKTTWLAVIDADEFLFSPEGEDLRKVFREYEQYPAIGVFLYCFGPSGHIKKPEGLVIENYRYRAPDEDWQNKQYKSIVQPSLMRSVIGAQRFHNIIDNTPAYDEDGLALVHSVDHDHKSKKLRINHYGTKSLEELQAKIQRNYFWTDKRREKRRGQKAQQHGALLDTAVEDLDIQRFVPTLKKVLNRKVTNFISE